VKDKEKVHQVTGIMDEKVYESSHLFEEKDMTLSQEEELMMIEENDEANRCIGIVDSSEEEEGDNPLPRQDCDHTHNDGFEESLQAFNFDDICILQQECKNYLSLGSQEKSPKMDLIFTTIRHQLNNAELLIDNLQNVPVRETFLEFIDKSGNMQLLSTGTQIISAQDVLKVFNQLNVELQALKVDVDNMLDSSTHFANAEKNIESMKQSITKMESILSIISAWSHATQYNIEVVSKLKGGHDCDDDDFDNEFIDNEDGEGGQQSRRKKRKKTDLRCIRQTFDEIVACEYNDFQIGIQKAIKHFRDGMFKCFDGHYYEEVVLYKISHHVTRKNTADFTDLFYIDQRAFEKLKGRFLKNDQQNGSGDDIKLGYSIEGCNQSLFVKDIDGDTVRQIIRQENGYKIEEMIGTCAYVKKDTLKAFVYQDCPIKDWSHLFKHGNSAQSIANYLENCKDIPQLCFQRRARSYLHGMLTTFTDKIICKKNVAKLEKLRREGNAKIKYTFEHYYYTEEYKNLQQTQRTGRSTMRNARNKEEVVVFLSFEAARHLNITSTMFIPVEFDTKWLETKNPLDIDVDNHFLNVLRCQDIVDEDVLNVFYAAFVGRTFYAPKEIEDWQIMGLLKGQGGTGKSIITQTICKMFPSERVGKIQSSMQTEFGWWGCRNSLICNIEELPKNEKSFRIDETDWKVAIEGSSNFSFNGKNVNPVQKPFPCHIIASTNEYPPMQEFHFAFSRRLLIIEFNKCVSQEDVDTELGLKALQQRGLHHCVGLRTLLSLLRKNDSSKSLHEIAPKYFELTRIEYEKFCNPIVRILRDENHFVIHNNCSVSFSELYNVVAAEFRSSSEKTPRKDQVRDVLVRMGMKISETKGSRSASERAAMGVRSHSDEEDEESDSPMPSEDGENRDSDKMHVHGITLLCMYKET